MENQIREYDCDYIELQADLSLPAHDSARNEYAERIPFYYQGLYPTKNCSSTSVIVTAVYCPNYELEGDFEWRLLLFSGFQHRLEGFPLSTTAGYGLGSRMKQFLPGPNRTA